MSFTDAQIEHYRIRGYVAGPRVLHALQKASREWIFSRREHVTNRSCPQ